MTATTACKTALSLVLILGTASACGVGGLNGGGGDDYNDDLDPLNPPDPPFPENPFPEDGTCGNINAVVNGVTPTVQLLIDQSGSMTADFGPTNRWDAVSDTLMGPQGVVAQLQNDVMFGVSLYTSFDGNAGGECPVMSEVPPALANFGAMNNVVAPAEPQSDTPTGEAIDAVAATLSTVLSPGPRIIVLGTDGEPDTCAEPNPQNGQQRAIEAAQRAYEQGINTIVVSVGDEVGERHLQDMANAGRGLAIGGTENAPYYVALDPDELVNSFRQIVGGVTGCVFTINGEVDPAKAGQGLVALDGEELTYGTEWIMVDSKSFEVLGGHCDDLQDGRLHHVSAVFPCGTIIVD